MICLTATGLPSESFAGSNLQCWIVSIAVFASPKGTRFTTLKSAAVTGSLSWVYVSVPSSQSSGPPR